MSGEAVWASLDHHPVDLTIALILQCVLHIIQLCFQENNAPLQIIDLLLQSLYDLLLLLGLLVGLVELSHQSRVLLLKHSHLLDVLV